MPSPPIPSLLERALAVIAPKRAVTSYAARLGLYNTGQWVGARRDKTSMRAWTPLSGSADSDTIGDLETLRSRSRDLARNAGIARGARNTSKVNVVGTGLRLKSELQREFLGLSDEAAEKWEDEIEVLFDLWAKSKMCDATRTQNFYELQGLAFLSTFDNGDVFALRRYKEGTSFLALCLQLIEADRVCDPTRPDITKDIRDGIEVNSDGEAVAYHLKNKHPGETATTRPYEPDSWERIPARGGSGAALMLHLFDRDRVGLTRGVPLLAPVIEDLKQLDRYTESELMAAVVSSFFTVFIKTADGGSDIVGEEIGGDPLPSNQTALGTGTIVNLGPGETIETADATRPNPNFDPFFLAIVRKIGIAIGIPYEVLIMHFSSSYSASRAALEVAWQFFMDRRTWLANNFCDPVYEWFLTECVARGIVSAPGFLDDPIKRQAWLGARWIGPAQISIDPSKESKADEMYIDMGIETVESVTIKRNGGDWWRNNEQRGREIEQRKLSKADISPARPAVPPPPKDTKPPGAA